MISVALIFITASHPTSGKPNISLIPTPTTQVYKIKPEPFLTTPVVRFELRNHTSQHFQFMVNGSNNRVTLTDAKGRPVARTRIGKIVDSNFGSATATKAGFLDLEPHGKATDLVSQLAENFELKPGRYRMTVLFRATTSTGHFDIKSSPLTLNVQLK